MAVNYNAEPILKLENLKQYFKVNRSFTVKAVDGVSFEIFPGEGVCGTALLKDEVQLVPDVHQFPGHIACDSASASELVIPIRKENPLPLSQLPNPVTYSSVLQS